MNIDQINQLKNELDQLRPLPTAAVRNLDEVYRIEWTYNSNAIEGNTLTLLETKLVLEEGLTIGGKKLREHFEVINHSEAISYVKDMVNRDAELIEYIMKSIHQISGSQHTPPHFTVVPEKMEQFIQWYHEQKDQLHPVELAAEFHFKFVYIHPFSDGNGRTARLLMNLILMMHGFPPAIVKAADEARLKYYESLEEASIHGNLNPFIQLIMGCVSESLQRYIAAVK